MKSNGGSTLDAIVTQHGFADLPGVRFAFDIAGQGDPLSFCMVACWIAGCGKSSSCSLHSIIE